KVIDQKDHLTSKYVRKWSTKFSDSETGCGWKEGDTARLYEELPGIYACPPKQLQSTITKGQPQFINRSKITGPTRNPCQPNVERKISSNNDIIDLKSISAAANTTNTLTG
ncbi:hypothetical protein Ahia01_000718500, partial [Argonauta hians]